jgi:hypothetical protein
MNNDRHRSKLENIRYDAPSVGLFCGYTGLHEIYQYKQGYPLVIYGLPFSGKSYFWFSMAIKLSQLHGKKHFVFSPETGSGAEVMEVLMQMYTGKDVRTKKTSTTDNMFAMSNSEYEAAYMFVREHFYVAETSDFPAIITIEDVYTMVKTVESSTEFTFDTVTIDPWAEITMHTYASKRYDLALSDVLGIIREHDAKEKNTTVYCGVSLYFIEYNYSLVSYFDIRTSV